MVIEGIRFPADRLDQVQTEVKLGRSPYLSRLADFPPRFLNPAALQRNLLPAQPHRLFEVYIDPNGQTRARLRNTNVWI